MSAEGVARPVWARVLPWSISEMAEQQEALTVLFGPDLHIGQRARAAVVYTPGESCDCLRCDQDLARVLETTEQATFSDSLTGQHMHLCAACGSKRCGQAKDHRLPCDEDPEMKALLEGTTRE